MAEYKQNKGMKMPEGFLWGGSLSAHQTEGAIGEEYVNKKLLFYFTSLRYNYPYM